MVKISPRDRLQIWETEYEQDLKDLQREVGGFIETVYDKFLMSGLVWVVNEEGKLNDTRFNRLASSLLFPDGDDSIFGDALIMMEDIDGDDEPFLRPLTPRELHRIVVIITMFMTDEGEADET